MNIPERQPTRSPHSDQRELPPPPSVLLARYDAAEQFACPDHPRGEAALVLQETIFEAAEASSTDTLEDVAVKLTLWLREQDMDEALRSRSNRLIVRMAEELSDRFGLGWTTSSVSAI